MIANTKGLLWALVFVLLLCIWLSAGCTGPLERWQERRQKQQEQRQQQREQRWDNWQDNRREQWQRGRWRERRRTE